MTHEQVKYALVTGGSSGIGLEFVKLLVTDGYRVIIISSSQTKLDKVKSWFSEHHPGAFIECVQQDLSVPGAAKKIFEYTTTKSYPIDILINNAGFATYGSFRIIDIEVELKMIDLNVKNIYHLTRLYLDEMLSRKMGKILITSSIAAFAPTPFFTTYAATKAFSYSFGLAIGRELKDLGSPVSITVLCAPSTRTGFQSKAKMDELKLFDRSNLLTQDPDFVAKKGYRALMKGKRICTPGWIGRLTLQLLNPLARSPAINWLMTINKLAMRL